MRLYNKKSIKNRVDHLVSAQSETRDAVLWEVDTLSHVCRVKIQGSDILITAHFPRNWQKTPYWLKRGNAVSVRHRGGVHGYVEVVGEGRAVPSPVGGGSGGVLPPAQPLSDMILSGCLLYATAPPSMSLIATSGTYRIGGVVYTFNPQNLTTEPMVMDDPPHMILGSGTVMGTMLYTLVLDAAPAAGWVRYDMFCVGVDGEIYYHKGAAVRSDPQKPVVPAGYLLFGKYILVHGGVTSVFNTDIGAIWSTPKPAALVLTHSSTHTWSGSDPKTTRTIKVELVDQYNQPLKISGLFKLEKALGTGDVYSADTGWHASLVTQNVSAASSYTFTYRRDQGVTETSPLFLATLQIQPVLMRVFGITLLDVNGNPI